MRPEETTTVIVERLSYVQDEKNMLNCFPLWAVQVTWKHKVLSKISPPATDNKQEPPPFQRKWHRAIAPEALDQHCCTHNHPNKLNKTHPRQEEHADQVDVPSLGCKVQRRHPSTRDCTKARPVVDQEDRQVKRAGIAGNQEGRISLERERFFRGGGGVAMEQ